VTKKGSRFARLLELTFLDHLSTASASALK
jgi:hypothetical protein